MCEGSCIRSHAHGRRHEYVYQLYLINDISPMLPVYFNDVFCAPQSVRMPIFRLYGVLQIAFVLSILMLTLILLYVLTTQVLKLLVLLVYCNIDWQY